jgi:cell division protein FtsW (lipid II flippase)
MRHLVSLVLFVAALTVIWWAGFPLLAVLLALLCGLAGLLYFIAGAVRAGDGRTEQEREGHERFLRDTPPPPG